MSTVWAEVEVLTFVSEARARLVARGSLARATNLNRATDVHHHLWRYLRAQYPHEMLLCGPAVIAGSEAR